MSLTGLRETFDRRGTRYGCGVLEFPTPGIGHILKQGGCDFAFIDMEHSGFGIDTITKGAKAFGDHSTTYLTFWSLIFIVVTFQMSTSLRPLLAPAEDTFLPTEKRFFLEHWGEVFQSHYD